MTHQSATPHTSRPSGHAGGHPGGHAGPGGPKVPLHEAIRTATPRWRIWLQAGFSWISAVSTAVIFLLLGVALDERADLSPWILPTTIGLTVLTGCAVALGAWFAQRAESDSERLLRQATVSRIFDRGVVEASQGTAGLLSLTTDATERVSHYRAGFIGPIIGALSTPFLVLAVMAVTVDAVTAGWLALLVLLVPVMIGGFQKLVRPVGAQYRRSQGRLTAAFLEAIQALDTLVYARAAGRTAEELAQRGEEHRRGLMRLLAGNQLLIFVVDAAFSLTVVVAAALLAASRVAAGDLSLGQGITIVLMTTLVIGPVDVVGQFFYIGIGGRAAQSQLSAHLGSGVPARGVGGGAADSRINTTAHSAASGTNTTEGATVTATDVSVNGTAAAETAAVPDQPIAGRSPVGISVDRDGALVLDGVTAGWPGGAPVLRGLSLRVERGERVALVGPSGVGKSTVSALLQAHLSPRAGRVVVDGLDTAQVDGDAVRSRLAVVEQKTFLFLGTIAENLRMAAPSATEQELWEALVVAGLDIEVRAMPRGLDTSVGAGGAFLSGGQAQRLAIARAALRDAPILLLDEPTSQVDLAGEQAILDALARLASGRTVLMIAHRPGAILAADRVITLTPHARSGAASHPGPGQGQDAPPPTAQSHPAPQPHASARDSKATS